MSDNSLAPISSTPTPLTVAARSITMHSLSGTELDAVASLSNLINLTFFGICSGSTISFSIVLGTGSGLSASVHSDYVALTAVSALGTIYFGIRGLMDYIRSKREIQRIKRGG